MKISSLFLGALAALAALTGVDAADLAARPYTKTLPPSIATLYKWGGFYVGGNGGYGNSRNCWNFMSIGAAPVTAGEGCHNADGAVAGGQVGYRWQSASWAFGVEAQGD